MASGLRPSFSAHSSEATTIAPAPSLTPGALPAVWVAPSPPTAPQLGQRLKRGLGTQRLVDLDRGVALAPLDRDGDDLVGESAASVASAASRCERSANLSMSARVISSSLETSLASLIICLSVKGLVSPSWVIASSACDVAHPEAEARVRQQVGRLAHRLHAAGDGDLAVAGADPLVGEAERAHARGADLVDRFRGDLLRDAALDLGLARGNLALAGLQDLAEDDLLDLLGADAGALQGGLDRDARRARARRAKRGRRPSCRPGCARFRGSLSWTSTGLSLFFVGPAVRGRSPRRDDSAGAARPSPEA